MIEVDLPSWSELSQMHFIGSYHCHYSQPTFFGIVKDYKIYRILDVAQNPSKILPKTIKNEIIKNIYLC